MQSEQHEACLLQPTMLPNMSQEGSWRAVKTFNEIHLNQDCCFSFACVRLELISPAPPLVLWPCAESPVANMLEYTHSDENILLHCFKNKSQCLFVLFLFVRKPRLSHCTRFSTCHSRIHTLITAIMAPSQQGAVYVHDGSLLLLPGTPK